MLSKPRVCIIDEDPRVKAGWQNSLGSHADVVYFRDHTELFRAQSESPDLLSSFSCIVFGRLFSHISLDVVKSTVPDVVARETGCPILLNWQGYVSKEELRGRFHGRIFHRYGVRWHTLRLRIQRLSQQHPGLIRPTRAQTPAGPRRTQSRQQRCFELLETMAGRARGEHRSRIEFFVHHDQRRGIEMLERLYNQLITDKQRPRGCPSRYINSSPVIAARIIHDALHT